MSDSEDPIDPIDEDGGDDLFGDDDDIVAAPSPKARVLDDDSLASDPEGDDDQPQYARDDRMRSQSVEASERRILPQTIERHNLPKPSDKTLRVMRVPKFFKLHPMAYDSEAFEPSEFDVANALSENPKQVVRFKKDPSTSELRSNTNVYRWSDGSVTISVGGEHYEVSKKRLGPAPDKPYNDMHDGHNYAASVELAANLLVTTDHISEQYNVRPNKEVGDEALSRLVERMAEERNEGVSENMIIRTTKDPEFQKKQAELAEKEREKARRRRENAAAKMDGGLGRSGGRGGLSIGDLEGGRRAGGRKRGVPGSGKPKRHRPEYDSDDDLPQGVGRHEEYDREDGFVVGSDDEEMDSGVEDDEEEELEEEDEAPRRKRQRTVEVDEDASGDDVEPAETTARSRRRNIIDEDEDDE